jgi:hypothetical protein
MSKDLGASDVQEIQKSFEPKTTEDDQKQLFKIAITHCTNFVLSHTELDKTYDSVQECFCALKKYDRHFFGENSHIFVFYILTYRGDKVVEIDPYILSALLTQ